MPVDEALVRRLVRDARIEDFERNLMFRTQVLNRVEAAELLIRIMAEADEEVSARARAMLCLFDQSALTPVATALRRPGALWRYDLLGVLWAIIAAEEPREWRRSMDEILPEVVRLFGDRDIVKLVFRFRPEIEYTFRVCDEALVFHQRITDPNYDESVFRGMDFAERDAEIRILQSRLRGSVS